MTHNRSRTGVLCLQSLKVNSKLCLQFAKNSYPNSEFYENSELNIKGLVIAESEIGQVWGRFEEFGKLDFFILEIISETFIDIEKGCKLTFLGTPINIEVDANLEKNEIGFSDVSNRWLTKMSFFITKTELTRIEEREFKSIELAFNKIVEPLKLLI